MAMRMHVVGAYGASPADFRAALDLIGGEGSGSQCFHIGSSGPWQWASGSVWQVSGSDIDQALASLPGPALRVTSSDAVLWMLALTRGDRELFRGVHHFTYAGKSPDKFDGHEESFDVDFPEEELNEVAGIDRDDPKLQFLWDTDEEERLKREYAEEAESTVAGLDDYTEYGVALPESVIGEMKQQPARGWHIALIAHGSQIVAALEQFGFEFDRDAVLELLTVGQLTELESDSDIGNMPRFLRTLGIDGVFSEELEPSEEPAADDDSPGENPKADVDWLAYPIGVLTQTLESLAAACALTEIDGGPVPLHDIALLHLLAHLCVSDPATSVLVEFPMEKTPHGREWEDLDSLEVKQAGATWQFCFETPLWWYGLNDREQLQTNVLAESLRDLPDGTRITITFAVAGAFGTLPPLCGDNSRSAPRIGTGLSARLRDRSE